MIRSNLGYLTYFRDIGGLEQRDIFSYFLLGPFPPLNFFKFGYCMIGKPHADKFCRHTSDY